jgi:uncharacterized membrane protein YhiD involved in acid resistance
MQAEIIDPQRELRLALSSAPGDLPLSSPEYQKELRDFAESLRSQGVNVSARFWAHDAVGGGGGYTGEFTLIIATIAPLVSAIIGAWLNSRYGRKAKVKIGEVEVEAQNVAEVRELMKLVEKYQKKTSHEG